jgi:long-chain acyl-CoA synthetase
MNITTGLRRALQVASGRTATICGHRRHTWADLGARVGRLAAGLLQLDVSPGDRIAVLMLNSDRYMELYLAVAWAGCVIVPVNTRWSQAEIEASLRDCEVRLLVADDIHFASGRAIANALDVNMIYAGDGTAESGTPGYESLIAGSASVDDAMRAGGELAAIFYTGGTTGQSKGVMLSHTNLTVNAFSALAEGLFLGDVTYLHVAPLFHVADAAIMMALIACPATHVFVPAFTPDFLCQTIEQHRVTHVLLVPTMIQMLVNGDVLSGHDLTSLRTIIYGSSPITESLLDQAAARLPCVQFVQGYGMTELSPTVTVLHHREHLAEARALGRHRSAGRAVPGCEVRIVDPLGAEVPRRSLGEIIARGDNVMMGYWRRPEETSRTVIDGWMHTGDAGYMDEDGFVFVVDRIKDMIISGGENVYSAEVENVLAKHPDVGQCAVIGIPNERWGEVVHAVVVPKSGTAPDPSEIIDFCRARIAAYKSPRVVHLRAQPLPLSGAGKILKRELRSEYSEVAVQSAQQIVTPSP